MQTTHSRTTSKWRKKITLKAAKKLLCLPYVSLYLHTDRVPLYCDGGSSWSGVRVCYFSLSLFESVFSSVLSAVTTIGSVGLLINACSCVWLSRLYVMCNAQQQQCCIFQFDIFLPNIRSVYLPMEFTHACILILRHLLNGFYDSFVDASDTIAINRRSWTHDNDHKWIRYFVPRKIIHTRWKNIQSSAPIIMIPDHSHV